MQVQSEVDGTDTAIHATSRARSQDSTGLHDIYSRIIKRASMLMEPFDLPGRVITNNLTLSTLHISIFIFSMFVHSGIIRAICFQGIEH
jgi:uncharacterized protein